MAMEKLEVLKSVTRVPSSLKLSSPEIYGTALTDQ
jgi:hypothetical protein